MLTEWFDDVDDMQAELNEPYRTKVTKYIHKKAVGDRRWAFIDPDDYETHFTFDELNQWLQPQNNSNGAENNGNVYLKPF